MSGNLNKLIFLFVGIFLTILLVAFFLGRFKLTPNSSLSGGSLGEALGFKKTTTPTPNMVAILPTQVLQNNQGQGSVLGTNPTSISLPTSIIKPTIYQMQYAPTQIPNTGSPASIVIMAGSMFGTGLYLIKKYS